MLFMIKSRYVLADNDNMENSVTEEACLPYELDDVALIIDDSSTYVLTNNDYMENPVTEACLPYELDDVTVIIDDSSTFESY